MLETRERASLNTNRLGMVFFIFSESVFFIFLILAYVYFQSSGKNSGPSAASSLDPLRTGIFSLFLFASSYTLWRADKNQGRGHLRRARLWLAATILLGLIFLAGQGLEWTRLILQSVTINRNLFGTTFFTLTGFHGLHVFLGLVALTTLLGLALGGRITSEKSAALGAVSLYWHFVDVVWVVIFTVVYLTIVI